jgi:hypothetical protein
METLQIINAIHATLVVTIAMDQLSHSVMMDVQLLNLEKAILSLVSTLVQVISSEIPQIKSALIAIQIV